VRLVSYFSSLLECVRSWVLLGLAINDIAYILCIYVKFFLV